MDTCDRTPWRCLRRRLSGAALAWGALAAALAGMLAGCTGSGGGVPTVDKVLVISVDTLRADYLGVYNPKLATSPEIDAFARDAVVFDDAITQATSTLPSHMSLFYSVHTFVHRAGFGTQPDPQVTSPIEMLRSEGFVTAAFVGGGQLRPRFGLDRGFDLYRQVDTRNINKSTRGVDRLARLQREVAGFLVNHRDDPFFLFVHNYEPHWPYDPPDRFVEMVASMERAGDQETDLGSPKIGYGVPAEAYLATNRRARYAAVVRYVDDFFGRLMVSLQELGLDDETLVIFLSDHGESLGDRGLIGHNRFYTEQLRVPLIVRMPGIEARRSAAPVQLLDIMPTILSALGMDPPYPPMGDDLMPLLRGEGESIPADRVRISENKGGAAVLQGDWKVIFNLEDESRIELYDRSRDPRELNDLSDRRPELAERLKRHYYDLVGENLSLTVLFPHDDRPAPLSDDVLQELRALGYIK